MNNWLVCRAAIATLSAALVVGLLTDVARADSPAMTIPGRLNVSQTGAATYSLPITVPPGTAGMVPDLSLRYSSQDGDGVMGLGWSIEGLPSITRCPRTYREDAVHGAVNYDANDRFCLQGQRLIGISGTYGANGTEYRTEIDSFSKIISYGSTGSGPSYFKVWTKSGLVLEFGNTTDSRFLAVGTSTARAWGLNKQTDTKGNYFTVTYTNDTTNGQAYPTRVDYTGNAGASLTPYNSVQFTYTTTRADVVPTYQAGSLEQTTALLTHIKTYQGTSVVYDYQLSYTAGTSTKHTELTQVALCDGAGTNCLAPTTFGWQGSRDTLTIGSTSSSLFFSNIEQVGDYNGDGLTDVVIQPYTSCTSGDVFLGNLSGTYSTSSLYGTNCVLSPFAAGDFNGDGLTDALRASGSSFRAFLNDGAGGLNPGTQFLSGLNNGDFDGDGRTDGFIQGNPSYVLHGNGDGTFTTSAAVGNMANMQLTMADFDGDGCTDVLQEHTDEDVPTGIAVVKYLCNSAVANSTLNATLGSFFYVLGDFNGDGKTDALQYSGANNLLLSTGTGFVTSSYTVPTAWASAGQILAGDFNGDGRQDLAIVNSSNIQFYLSTGNGFSLALTQSTSGTMGCTVGDYNSDGAQDLWCGVSSSSSTEYTFSYVPELMTTISNGAGATTTVAYDRINKNGTFYAKGSLATFPDVTVDSALYAVSQIAVSDTLGGNYVTNYSYGGAYSDHNSYSYANWTVTNPTNGRLTGFKTVTATDPQTTIVTATNYRSDFPYAGLVSSQTRVLPGGTPVTLSSVTNTYASSTGTGIDSTSYYNITLTETVSAANDIGGYALPTTTTDYTYDSYDNPLTVTATLTGGATRTVTNTYTNDATNWILGQLINSQTESVVGTSDLFHKVCYQHDSSTGLVTREVIEPVSTSSCTYSSIGVQTDYTIDAFGNRTVSATSGTGITSRSTSATYTDTGDATGRFLLTSTNPLSQTDTFTYDANFGGMTGRLDPSNESTFWSYDTLGRKTLETRPDGTKTAISYAFCSGVNGGSASCPTHGAYLVKVEVFANDGTTHIGPTSYGYYDALGRVIASDTQGFDGSNIRVATQYDANLRVSQTSRPYFTTGGTAKWTAFTYDALARVTRATAPDTSHTDYAYQGLTTSVTDALSHTTTTVRNNQGQIYTITDAASHATTYTYNAFDQVLTATDPSGNVITNAYDTRGNKTDSTDPDLGHWVYTYDVLGELATQVDAKSQTTSMTYDLAGHPTQRTEADLTTTWTWGNTPASHDVGKLISNDAVGVAAGSATSHFTRNTSYDSVGRPSQTTFVQTSYTYTTAYNTTNGQVDTVTYPSGFVAKWLYNGTGYACRVTDNGGSHTCTTTSDAHVLWTGSTADAELHLLTQTAGNAAFTTTQTFDANTGSPLTIYAGPSNTVAQLGYTWDAVGNLTARQDGLNSIFEKYCYDNLNRLTDASTATLGAGGQSACTSSGTNIVHKTASYDALGNITAKSDAGTYSYPASGSSSVRPHAVSGITGTVGGVTNPTYTYDGNGNMTGGAGRVPAYTSFNALVSIGTAGHLHKFLYDGDHNRFRHNYFVSGLITTKTQYFNDPVSGSLEELVINGTTSSSWNDYIKIGGLIVAERSCAGTATPATPCTGTVTWQYMVTDQLGSVATVTNGSGGGVVNQSYDAWGLRRNSNGTDDSTCSVTSTVNRGYTSHEHIDNGSCAINANARIYDPVIARFLSADTMVPDPLNGQAFNRYSYVNNNPLNAIDPSGHECEGKGTGCKWWYDSAYGCATCSHVAEMFWTQMFAGIVGQPWDPTRNRSTGGRQCAATFDTGCWRSLGDTSKSDGRTPETVTLTSNGTVWVSAQSGCSMACAYGVKALAFGLGGLTGVKLASRFLPRTRGTLQIGYGASGILGFPGTPFGIAYQGSGGIVIDTNGDGGIYGTYGRGVGAGVSEATGFTFQGSNGYTADDVAGPFNEGAMTLGDALGGTVDLFSGNSLHGPVSGGGISPGEGAGLSITGMSTNTWVWTTSGGHHW